MDTPTNDTNSASAKASLSPTLKFGLIGAAVLLTVAAVVFFKPGPSDPALAKRQPAKPRVLGGKPADEGPGTAATPSLQGVSGAF